MLYTIHFYGLLLLLLLLKAKKKHFLISLTISHTNCKDNIVKHLIALVVKRKNHFLLIIRWYTLRIPHEYTHTHIYIHT